MSSEFKTSESQRISNQKYRQKPEVRESRKKLNKEWIARNRERYNEAKSEYRFKLKLAAISHYSNGTMCCNFCGYSEDIDALFLDHINDNGAEHRRELGISGSNRRSGTTMYERLKALGWIDGLQVLCANCNTIKELQRKRGKTSKQMQDATAGKIRWRK